MATKGSKGLFSSFKSPFSKPDPAAKKEEEQKLVSGGRTREREMLAMLNDVSKALGDPQRKLSQAKVDALNISGVIAYAKNELSVPLIIEYDTTNMDNNIKKIIQGLESAVKNGLEITSEWACTALVHAIKNLRVQVDGIDEEYGAEMMQARAEYSFNLELLVKSCIKYDKLEKDLADQYDRRKRERAELDRKKQHYMTRRDSGALDTARQILAQYTHNPAMLSQYPEARALRDELAELHRLKASLTEIDVDINVKQADLNGAKNEIKSRRNALATMPTVTDPKLQEKINEANRRYRERLNDQLNRAEKELKDYKAHITAMEKIGDHGLFITMTADALAMDQDLQMERYNTMLAQQQAAEMRSREAANSEFLSSTIQNNIHVQEDLPDIDIITEPEQELQYETLVELE